MKEERMKILDMLENGRITAEEAAKLIESLGVPFFDCDCENEDFNEKVRDFGKDAENFLKSIGGRMNGFYKDMEPKVKNVTKTVVERTADIIEEIGKALSECLHSLGHFCEPKHDGCCCKEHTGDEEQTENHEN